MSSNSDLRTGLAAVVNGVIGRPCAKWPDVQIHSPAAVIVPGGDGRYERPDSAVGMFVNLTVTLLPGGPDDQPAYDLLDEWIEALRPALVAADFTYLGAQQPRWVSLGSAQLLACDVIVQAYKGVC